MRAPRALLIAALGLVAALAPAIALRGFTVDDALISARYAAHLARGLGYRFNEGGPVTDGVTPLGWPYLLAPFASGGPLAALAAAKILGVVAWALAAAILALAIDRVGGLAAPSTQATQAGLLPSSRTATRQRGARFAALLLIATSAPLGAWSVAGMETGLVIALAALGVALRQLEHPRAGAGCAGLAAALRPELIPWALVLGAAPSPGRPIGDRTFPARLAAAALPAALCAGVRLLTFGKLVPLSVLAKPSSPELGARYALACFLLTGPVALLAPLAFRRLDGFARGLVLSVGVHFVAIAFAGGDWMPLSRLAAPVLPAVALAAAHLAAVADLRATAARMALALGGEIFQLVRVGPSAAGTFADRLQVIDELRAPLASARVVAALDVGWLGAASSATIVDLAGLTDPAIAALPGGHTSKPIPVGLLDARKVDTIVLLLKDGEPLAVPWTESFFARIVELRIASIPHIEEAFGLVAESHAPHLRYVVLRRIEGARTEAR
jgi:hypothetical protein